jgi:hypothetical protein
MRRDYRDHLARFFLPTHGLTEAILLTNAALVAADEEEPDEDDVSESKEHDEGYVWEVEDEEHPQRVAHAEVENDEPIIERGRFVIADQLYNYLAYLSHTPRSYHHIPFDLYEVIPSGMEALLGLEDSEKRAQLLLTRLTDEFRGDMLERHGGYYGDAPWGDVILKEDGRFLLFKAKGVEEAEPPDRYERAVQRVRSVRRR